MEAFRIASIATWSPGFTLTSQVEVKETIIGIVRPELNEGNQTFIMGNVALDAILRCEMIKIIEQTIGAVTGILETESRTQ